jgi:ribosomal protein L37AE/L43A
VLPSSISRHNAENLTVLCGLVTVLQVPLSSSYWYQKALLSSELVDIFSEAPLAPNSLAHPRVREAYARVTGKAMPSSSPEEERDRKKRIPGPEDDCPICYESMHKVAENKLWFCEECGNALHGECFRQCTTLLLLDEVRHN